jgi:hypothetical protein
MGNRGRMVGTSNLRVVSKPSKRGKRPEASVGGHPYGVIPSSNSTEIVGLGRWIITRERSHGWRALLPLETL